jgi:lipopolysaccharide biosynthesis glycosyltransferase
MTNIPIVYTTDKKYLSYAKWAAKITAIHSNLSLQILILCIDDVPTTIISEKNSRITIVSIQSELSSLLRGLPEKQGTYAHITVAAYLRLLLPDLLPDFEFCIYLDVDTLTLLDIKELMDCANTDFLVQGVRRPYYPYLSHLGFGIKSVYINSGVLIMNLSAWRKSNITALSFALINEMRERIIHPDQDVLNIACADRIGCLNPKFNLHPLMPEPNVPSDLVREINSQMHGAIVHFYGDMKVWSGCFNMKWQQRYRQLAQDFVPILKPEHFTKTEAALYLQKAHDFARIGDSLSQLKCIDASNAILSQI